ncbi:metal ABC transporter substrate-binding protein [Roseomonas xinghualingensis]|uniref:metal ABC transporter substrate-binding protein n=1 Tax=Roseomonas xinghualingensis TaxID=2986475 RepID=UPI0021F0C095|nr:metal ABC transporter substrate-binding protein [Roseomonas sp. SXEYE001]MCV4206262.1 metal ABC transporter substrate-binding protein [Roseomonas sp. SXEYE001]
MSLTFPRRLILAAALAVGTAMPAMAQSQAPGAPKRVVATFTVLADMARNVAGDGAIVESLTRPGAEIHDYDPTPQDVVRAQGADLVLWNGMGLERWFERFFGRVNNVRQAVLTEGVEPIGIGEGPYKDKPNPHAWMSPTVALTYVENIRKALTDLDPARADLFAANARAYSEQIKAVDARLREQLAAIPAERRVLATCEGAFSYLTKDYGMREAYLWPINAEDEGTPRQVRALIDTLRRTKPPAAFCESTVNDRPMRQVAQEAGVRFGGALHVDSLTAEDGPAPSYLRLLEANAETILRAFGAGQAVR